MGNAKGDCCSAKSGAIRNGIIYGLVPHAGCIAFIAASLLGATVAVELFKPLLMNPLFFHALVFISLAFATISSVVYLRKNGMLSFEGVKRKKGYLSAMYGLTVGINLLLFMVVFPLLANIEPALASVPTAAVAVASAADGADSSGKLAGITLAVDIPCPGHAPLISSELRKLAGVEKVTYELPNRFRVSYYPSKTTKEEMLALEVFGQYPATVVGESSAADGSNANFGSVALPQASAAGAGQTASGGCGCCSGG